MKTVKQKYSDEWLCPFHKVPQNRAQQANDDDEHDGDPTSIVVAIMPQE